MTQYHQEFNLHVPIASSHDHTWPATNFSTSILPIAAIRSFRELKDSQGRRIGAIGIDKDQIDHLAPNSWPQRFAIRDFDQQNHLPKRCVLPTKHGEFDWQSGHQSPKVRFHQLYRYTLQTREISTKMLGPNQTSSGYLFCFTRTSLCLATSIPGSHSPRGAPMLSAPVPRRKAIPGPMG